jgi:hypothetical protein
MGLCPAALHAVHAVNAKLYSVILLILCLCIYLPRASFLYVLPLVQRISSTPLYDDSFPSWGVVR